MFTCTGSEANDLAIRIAKHRTGHQGMIITSEAYHGNSDADRRLLALAGRGLPARTWVRRVPAPDSYRIDPVELATWFAARCAEQIDDLERHGEGLAAFIADSLFSSDGIFADPTDLLAQVARGRAPAGGLFDRRRGAVRVRPQRRADVGLSAPRCRA